MKAGSLTTNYLNNWLKETCAELVTLEKDAAPDGWLLQWDRYEFINLYFKNHSQIYNHFPDFTFPNKFPFSFHFLLNLSSFMCLMTFNKLKKEL